MSKNIVIGRVRESGVVIASEMNGSKGEMLLAIMRWIIMKMNRRRGSRDRRKRVIRKYIEYNAMVAIVLILGRGGVREREYRKVVKYRILRGVVGVVMIMR